MSELPPIPQAVGMMPIIRPDCCKGCKFRSPDPDGTQRCHGGPPQRSVILVPGPRPGMLGMEVKLAFPEIPDDVASFWWCRLFEKKVEILKA